MDDHLTVLRGFRPATVGQARQPAIMKPIVDPQCADGISRRMLDAARAAAVDIDDLAGHETCALGTEKQHHRGDLL